MKKIIAIVLVAVLAISSLSVMMFSAMAADNTTTQTNGRTISYYTGARQGDISWFDETNIQSEYTLTTADQFYGFMVLVNAKSQTFDGVTVKLGCDVGFNVGDSTTWTAEMAENGTLYNWIPIGNDKNGAVSFHGTFDGQGHFISGIMSVKDRDNGLFLHCENATVKNFAVVNSVFWNTGADSGKSQGNSSVVTRCKNTVIENVYSNAYVKGGFAVGGIVGYFQGNTNGMSQVRNCVFAGTVDAKTNTSGYSGGLIGGDESAGKAEDATKCGVIENCIFTGKYITDTSLKEVTNKSDGGFIGCVQSTIVRNCINAGTVDLGGRDTSLWGDIVGRLVGGKAVANTVFENNFYDSTKAINNRVVGSDDRTKDETTGAVTDPGTFNLDSCKGLEGVASFTAANLTGFDFTNTWTAIEGNYPMPTAAYNIYNAIKDINFVELEAPEETTPEVTTPEATTPEQTTPEQTTPEQTTPEETSAKTPDATVTTAGNTDDDTNSGCASVVGTGAVVVILCGFGIAAIATKKEKK